MDLHKRMENTRNDNYIGKYVFFLLKSLLKVVKLILFKKTIIM